MIVYQQEEEIILETLEELKERLTDIGEPVEDLQAAALSIKADLTEMSDQKDEKSEEVLLIQSGDKLRKYIDAMATETGKIASAKERLKHLQKRQKLYDAGQCPTCERPMEAGDLVANDIIESIKLNTKRIKAHKTTWSRLSGKRDVLDGKIVGLNTIIGMLTKDITIGYVQYQEALQKVAARTAQYDELDLRIRDQEKELKRVRMSMIKKKRSARIRKQKVARIERFIEQLKFWKKGFGPSGIPTLVLEGYITVLNEHLELLTDKLTDGQISIALEMGESGKILLLVKIEGGGESYVTASGGQSKRVDLCIALALQTLVKSRTNLLVFDEFDDSLDPPGIETFAQFLRESSEDKSVFVISHNPETAQHFDATIKIERTNGTSIIK